MTKRNKYFIVSLLMIVSGWLGIGFGYGSSNLGPILLGILFFGGLSLFISGIIVFILGTKEA